MSEQTGVGGEESVSGELGERVRALVAAAEGMAAAVRSDADNYALTRRREVDAEAERRLREASEQADALLAERLTRISDLSDRTRAAAASSPSARSSSPMWCPGSSSTAAASPCSPTRKRETR